MKPKHWQQIEKLCHAALEREESQRVPFLQEACGGDGDLHREVEHLQAQKTEAEKFLESPALELEAKTMAQHRVDSLVGREIGCPACSWHRGRQDLFFSPDGQWVGFYADGRIDLCNNASLTIMVERVGSG